MLDQSYKDTDDTFSSIANGSLKELEDYLQNGGNSNLKNTRGTTLLHQAVQENHTGKVKLLLQHTCDVNMADQTGCAPVYTAISKGHNSVLEILLEAGADLNVVLHQQMTPLIHAVKEENAEAVRLILTKGRYCDANIENVIRQTALTLAIIGRNKPICEILLKNGASENGIHNRYEITEQAAYLLCIDSELLTLFLEYNVEIDLHKPLIEACKLKRFDVVQLLLSKLEDPFHENAIGYVAKYAELNDWERLVKPVVMQYSLATKSCKENKLLATMLDFCNVQCLDNRRSHGLRAMSLVKVLVKHGLVIHPQTSIRSCSRDCDCRRCILTALEDLDPVPSLESQCCSVIRQHVIKRPGHFDMVKVNSLPLPSALKEFVCMSDW